MEETTNQVPPQTNISNTPQIKKSGNNVLMLLIMLGLFVIFGILIYAIKMNNEADYMSVIKPENILNPAKRVNTPSPQGQVEGTESIEAGDIDTELQDLSSDVQGL